MNTDFPTPQDGGKQEHVISAKLMPRGEDTCVDFTIDGKEADGVWIAPEMVPQWELIVSSVNSIAGMREQNARLGEVMARLTVDVSQGRVWIELDGQRVANAPTSMSGENGTGDVLVRWLHDLRRSATPPQENKA